MIDRRRLFALLGGAAVAPLLPAAAPAAEVVTRYTHRTYSLGYVITKDQVVTTRWMRAEVSRLLADRLRSADLRISQIYSV